MKLSEQEQQPIVVIPVEPVGRIARLQVNWAGCFDPRAEQAAAAAAAAKAKEDKRYAPAKARAAIATLRGLTKNGTAAPDKPVTMTALMTVMASSVNKSLIDFVAPNYYGAPNDPSKRNASSITKITDKIKLPIFPVGCEGFACLFVCCRGCGCCASKQKTHTH
jgi:hypothetical protein